MSPLSMSMHFSKSDVIQELNYELMNVRDTAYKKAKVSKSPRDWEIAKEARNHLNRSILKAKRDYMTDTISS